MYFSKKKYGILSSGLFVINFDFSAVHLATFHSINVIIKPFINAWFQIMTKHQLKCWKNIKANWLDSNTSELCELISLQKNTFTGFVDSQ